MKIQRTIKNIKRFNQIISILIKNGFYEIADKITGGSVRFNREDNINLNVYERIRITIEELGPTFIKLAQMLSTRPDLVPIELIEELEKLQDNVKPVEFEKIKPVLEKTFNAYIEEGFIEIKLIASASIGQVYKAILKNGEVLAIKVKKPGIEEIIETDIDILKSIAELFDDIFTPYGIKSLKEIIEEFEKYISEELNFLKEAKNLKKFANHFKNDRRLKIPKLYEEYSNKDIITMEFIDGIKITDVKKYDEYNLKCKWVTKQVFEILVEQIFIHRFFHADPHPGNILITKNKKIAFVDFGLMGSITKQDQKIMLDFIYYLIKDDEEKAALNLLKMTIHPENLDIDSFVRDSSKFINDYFLGSLKDIDFKEIFYDMTKMIAKYNIYLKKEYFLLFKALVIYEGVAKKIYADFNVFEFVKPIILKIYKKEYSLKNILLKLSSLPKEVNYFFEYTYYDLREIIKLTRENKLTVRIKHIGLEEVVESVEKSINRLTLAIILAAILIGSSILVYSNIPPIVFGMPLFGMVGFLIAFIMALILIYSIYKGGKL